MEELFDVFEQFKSSIDKQISVRMTSLVNKKVRYSICMRQF